MVKWNVELSVISILVVTNVECRDNISDWGDVKGEQDRPEDGTLRDSVFADGWR